MYAMSDEYLDILANLLLSPIVVADKKDVHFRYVSLIRDGYIVPVSATMVRNAAISDTMPAFVLLLSKAGKAVIAEYRGLSILHKFENTDTTLLPLEVENLIGMMPTAHLPELLTAKNPWVRSLANKRLQSLRGVDHGTVSKTNGFVDK